MSFKTIIEYFKNLFTYKKERAEQMPDPSRANKYFKFSEFGCKCESCEFVDGKAIDERIPAFFYDLRVAWGRPVYISSGIRCPVHNNRVGGVLSSKHLPQQGACAADTNVMGDPPQRASERSKARQIARKHGATIGFKTGSTVTHIDFRETRIEFNY